MKDKKNRHMYGAVDKSSSEQYFRKSTPLPLLCEISGVLHLAQQGFTAGRWQAGRRNAGKFRNI